MSNLLEKASIVTTPTAYDNGKILSVKPAPSLGSELITNGGFDTDSGWNKQTSNWTIVNGYAVCDGLQTSNSSLFQDVAVINGKSYRIDFTITNSVNNLNLILGATTIGQYGSGTHSIYVTKDSNASARIFFQATASNAFQGSLDNVSVKELIDGDFDFTRNSSATRVNAQGLVEDVQILSSNLVSNGDFSQEGSELITNGDFATDSDWSKGTGWSISGGKGIVTNATAASIYQDVLTLSKSYKASFTISSIENGSLKIGIGLNFSQEFTEVGTYTYYGTPSNDSLLRITPSNGTNATIDNVSVKEVGQDWTLGTGVTVGENKAIFTSTASGQSVSQNAVASSLTNGALAKVSFEVLSRTEGSFGVYFSGTLVGTLASAGVFTGYFTKGTETSFYIRALGTTSGSISNISVIEITDDTNLPRIDYTGGEGHWLFEPQSTNLVTYSEDFSQSYWDKSEISVVDDFTISLDGTQNASKITINGSTPFLGNTNISLTTGNVYTISCFVKKGTNRWVRLSSVSSTSLGAWFDLDNNVVGTVNSTSASIENYGNGWYRISNTITAISGTNQAFIGLSDADSGTNSTQVGNTVFAWGFQVEQNSYATSYIPTNGSTVTRLADAAFGAGSSDLINSTEGVLYINVKYLVDNGLSRKISISDGTDQNRIYITPYQSLAGRIRYIFTNNYSTQADLHFTTDLTVGKKLAFVWALNRFEVWQNGIKVLEDTSGSTPIAGTFNQVSLGSELGNASENFEGELKALAIFKEALTDEELTCLTTI